MEIENTLDDKTAGDLLTDEESVEDSVTEDLWESLKSPLIPEAEEGSDFGSFDLASWSIPNSASNIWR